MVESAARKESDLGKLSQKIVKAEEKVVKDVNKLSKDKFACKADAIPGTIKIIVEVHGGSKNPKNLIR
ncbi:hypothetical protein [Microcoleus sp. B9-D4]|uniref:hypothetical protein n=1 Tax=Microcoleus sp. B9-D4 TaxID=2818711 RepID=UPI002FD4C323